MKRTTSDGDASDAKRQKVEQLQDDDPLFQPTQRRKATDICEQGCDGTGYLEGRVQMKWPVVSGKLRIRMESQENGQVSRFEVNFIGTCVTMLLSSGFNFDIGDVIQVSLKGAERKMLKNSNSMGLPMELTYQEKLAIRFLKRAQPLAPLLSINNITSVVDTVPRKQISPLDEPQQDWFSTQTNTNNSAQAIPPRNNDSHANAEVIPNPSAIPQKFAKKAEKKARREAQRAQRKEESAQEPVPEPAPALELTPAQELTRDIVPQPERDDEVYWENFGEPEEPLTTPPVQTAFTRSSQVVQETRVTEAPISISRSGTLPPVVHHIQTTGYHAQQSGSISAQGNQDVFPGLTLPNGFHYAPLKDLLPSGKDTYMSNTIGVVINAERLQHTKDYSRKVILVDPSNWEGELVGKPINCFSQNVEGNLPDNIQQGDIILLRNIRARLHNGNVQVLAPSYKFWEWAIVDLKHLRSQGGPSPEHRNRFQPSPDEIQYCIRLNDWWQDVLKQHQEDNANVIVHNLADLTGGTSAFSRKQTREHRLIRDASPDLPPQGYFDCTVEVLYKYENQNYGSSPISIYVTDYTRNKMVAPQQHNWCHSNLADKVLQIEMWDYSRESAMTMEPGQFYLLRNVRMRRNGGGSYEGKMQEDKITKLDSDELENQPHLAALLKRKQEHEQEDQVESQFPHKLLEEAELGNKFFRCTVQVLGLSHKDDNRSFIYVTDYTSRQDFAPVYFKQPTGCTVGNDQILKVEARDEQARTAMSLAPGDFVAFRNIRLMVSTTNLVTGRIAGNERLIFKLNPNGTGNEDLIDLLQRKEEWDARLEAKKAVVQNATKKSKPPKKVEKAREKEKATSSKKSYETLLGRTRSIREVQEYSRCPWRFYVRARLVDYYPLDLEESVILRCSSCDKNIPDQFNECPDCVEDMADSSAEPKYCFDLEIQDEDGETLTVEVRRKENTLLGGLEPAVLGDDFEVFEQFREKISPILGNLEEVHQGIKRNKTVKPDTPFAIFEILSRQDGNKRGYEFMNHWLPDGDPEEE